MSHYNCGPDNPNFGKRPWNKGIPGTLECREKISRSLMGNTRRKGIPHSQETKDKISRPGTSNPRWNGGRYLGPDGYWMVFNPGHSRARNGRYVCEHLLIAEKALGRPIVLGKELVHHINGDKSDNRNKNLLICSKSFHYWLHAHMSQLYQKEHFGTGSDCIGNTKPSTVPKGE